MANVLGKYSFLDIPDVNGDLVLTTATGINSVTGTADQISVSGTLPAYTLSLADNAILPGTASLTLPAGTTAQRPVTPTAGMVRYSTTFSSLELYNGTVWLLNNRVLQISTGTIPAASGSTTVPVDATIPTVTEGWQIWTRAFTPISATSRIVIQFSVTTAHSATGTNVCSVFAGTTNIGSSAQRTDTVTSSASNISISIVHQPGSIAPITFSARLGNSAAGTSYCNQLGATNTLGGALATEYIITEIQ